MDSKDLNVTKHLLIYCDDIYEMQNEFGKTLNDFNNSKAYRHSCCLCLVQIGELVGHLSQDYKDTYNHIDWKKLKFLRNLIAHSYGEISYSATWKTLVTSVPSLKQFCETVIQQYEKEQSSAPQNNTPSIDDDELER